jgi:hypothetical protein
MKALIDTNTPVQYTSSWTDTNPSKPIFSVYENSARVCQVEPDANIFSVGEPLFWTDCADDVVADSFYYDTVNNNIYPVVNEPRPIATDQPVTTLPSA